MNGNHMKKIKLIKLTDNPTAKDVKKIPMPKVKK